MRLLILLFGISCSLHSYAQDTTLIWDKKSITLPEVILRKDFDYRKILNIIKEDTSFYKAFKNLRILEFTGLNSIFIFDKKNRIKASSESKTRQHRSNGCRHTEYLYENTTGDFYAGKRNYNYTTAKMYASLFIADEPVCGETNIINDIKPAASKKSGLEKHKEQLKMLFFNPGKKIPGIPFIGNKLDVYSDKAAAVYDYKLDYGEYKGKPVYVFSIKPKKDLGIFRKDDVVIDEMTTWFDLSTMEVLARNYALSYGAGVYDFDVQMEVRMTHFDGMLVPEVLRYKGNWNIIFKKRENAAFTATLFDFKR